MSEFFLDPQDLDTSVDPGSDFYLFANGGWIKRNPLPDEESRFGTFDLLSNQNKERLKILFEEFAAGVTDQNDPSAEKISVFFRSAIDEDSINAAGIQPLIPKFQRIADVKNFKGLTQEIAIIHTEGLSPVFNFYGAADMMNSQWVIAELYQGGLGLSDRDYYTDFDNRSDRIRKEYWNYVRQAFILAGSDSSLSADQANDIMEIETALAEYSLTRLEQRNPNAIYHKQSLAELETLCPAFQWNDFFSILGIAPPAEINVSQPDFFIGLSTLLKSKPLEKWKNYLQWNWINSMAPYLNDDFVNLHFDFFGKTLSGKQIIQPRWKRAVQATNHALGMLVGQYYVKKYFPPEAKARMKGMVHNIKLAMGKRIGSLEWMNPSTRDKALSKLEKIRFKVGYPDQWKKYDDLIPEPGSFAVNVMRSLGFEHRYNLEKIGKPVDPDEWGMFPQTVNAYYNPNQNEIVFPAAILQPPFFYADGDDAINYGAIGMIIGHELTHGFDDQGRHFDENGNLTDWWTEEDAQRFSQLTGQLVEQFNQYRVQENLMANGALTLGENIADLGGLSISLDAYRLSLEDPDRYPIFEGYTGLQRFFLSYARVWANSIRPEEVFRRTKEDVHSLGELRVNGPLSNMPEFFEAFGVKTGDPMYRPPEARARIW